MHLKICKIRLHCPDTLHENCLMRILPNVSTYCRDYSYFKECYFKTLPRTCDPLGLKDLIVTNQMVHTRSEESFC